jgi:hypothetical protein
MTGCTPPPTDLRGRHADDAEGDRDREDHEDEQRPRHRRARLPEAFLARARALAVAGDEVLAGALSALVRVRRTPASRIRAPQ